MQGRWGPATGGERALAVSLAGNDQRVEDGGALLGIRMADPQLIRFPDAGRAWYCLDQVVVEVRSGRLGTAAPTLISRRSCF